MGTVGELEAVSEWANFNDPTVGFYTEKEKQHEEVRNEK